MWCGYTVGTHSSSATADIKYADVMKVMAHMARGNCIVFSLLYDLSRARSIIDCHERQWIVVCDVVK